MSARYFNHTKINETILVKNSEIIGKANNVQ